MNRSERRKRKIKGKGILYVGLVGGHGAAGQPLRHTYMRKLLQDQAMLLPARPTYALIKHDNWCAVWQGGYCNCEPEIEYTFADATKPGSDGLAD